MTARWYITQHAIERYLHARGWPHDDEHFERGEDELLALSRSATLRETRGHMQLWRSGRPMRLRWVVSTAPRDEGPLPQVVWVGQGRPPERWWS